MAIDKILPLIILIIVLQYAVLQAAYSKDMIWFTATENKGYALIGIHESRSALKGYIVANKNFEPIYKTIFATKVGDLIRVRGQVEFTNENSNKPVRGILQLFVNNSPISVEASQNCVYDPPDNDSHHTPLWMDGLYKTTSDFDQLVVSVDFKVPSPNPWPALSYL